MNITTHIDQKLNLRIHKLVGKMDKDSFIDKLQAFYEQKEEFKKMHSIWDLTHADMTSFSLDDLKSISSFVVQHWNTQGDCRAALIADSLLNSRITQLYADQVNYCIEKSVNTFEDYDSALQWIQEA